MLAHMTPNTEKRYLCTNCGSPGNIIREGSNPRLKCTSCSFMYDASDSISAEEAGLIPEGPPKLQESQYEQQPPNDELQIEKSRVSESTGSETYQHMQDVPRLPSYVFISESGETEFTGKREFKKAVLRWEHLGKKYKVYELNQVKVSANISIK